MIRRGSRGTGRVRRGVVVSGMLVWAVLLAACTPARSQGPDPAELFDEPGALSLARAVQEGEVEEIAELVATGTDVESTGTHGTTMLQWAVMTGSLDGLSALLDAGADPDRTGHDGNGPVHLAAFHSDPAFLQALLEAGADPDLRGEVTGATALKDALLNNAGTTFRLLLEAGTDVNAVDRNGDGPIHVAARTNNGSALLALLEAGADPHATTSRENTFQAYYFRYDPDLLNDRARAERAQVVAWLDAHDIPVDPRGEQFREEG